MANQIADLCGKITLMEGEQNGLEIADGEIEEARVQGGKCLVGKLWMGRKANSEAFKTVLSRIWRIRVGVKFKELHDNLWLFEFGEVDDMRRVLDGRPWSYDRHMLVLTKFDGSIPPMQMKFVHSPFWIQVHDMPLLCMTKSVGAKIANLLGTLEEVDVAGSGVGWGRCLRLRVVLDISKPLERGRALVLNGNTLWVNFKY
jgi:hypothetical protein